MIRNPHIYEINTRVWLRRFDSESRQATLSDVPLEYWKQLSDSGIHFIWLMGIWKTCDSLIDRCCFQESLVTSYNKALKDWHKEDIIGSPYAVDDYEINPAIGTSDELKQLRLTLNQLGMKLILDFIPNHFSADSKVKKNNPEVFLQCKEEFLLQEPHTFFRSKFHKDIIFAHGRDPFFPAWTDTVQVNYFSNEARNFMIKKLEQISSIADGVRCDMAMLVMNNVFNNTWRGVIDEEKFPYPKDEFWKLAIENIKKNTPDFIFIAEAYWNLEWDLQQLGFDYTYDKRLLDRLKDGTPKTVVDHLKAELEFQEKSMRFIENHDEDRAITSLGFERSLAAAIIISTTIGMRLFNDGQYEGKRIKLPLQLGREPKEHINQATLKFYEKLNKITISEVFHNGKWELLEALKVWEKNYSSENIIAYTWTLNSDHRLIVVNYSSSISQCRLKLDVKNFPDEFKIFDLLNNKEYIRSSEEVYHLGLFIELAGWQSHIFKY